MSQRLKHQQQSKKTSRKFILYFRKMFAFNYNITNFYVVFILIFFFDCFFLQVTSIQPYSENL